MLSSETLLSLVVFWRDPLLSFYEPHRRSRRSAWWMSASGHCLGEQTISSTDGAKHRGVISSVNPITRVRLFLSTRRKSVWKYSVDNNNLARVVHRFTNIGEPTMRSSTVAAAACVAPRRLRVADLNPLWSMGISRESAEIYFLFLFPSSPIFQLHKTIIFFYNHFSMIISITYYHLYNKKLIKKLIDIYWIENIWEKRSLAPITSIFRHLIGTAIRCFGLLRIDTPQCCSQVSSGSTRQWTVRILPRKMRPRHKAALFLVWEDNAT